MRRGVVIALLFAATVARAADSPPCPAIAGSEGLLSPGSTLLLGELHGTVESPDFVASLACRAATAGLEVVVGLELSPSAQAGVDLYLDSAGTAENLRALLAHPLWQAGYQDGRTSEAMVALIDRLRQLRAAGHDVNITMFDASGRGGGQQRERAMAANLARSIESRPEALHIVLTGNIHSRVTRGVGGKPDYEPMGHVLKHTVLPRPVTALDVAHDGGTAWICAPQCGVTRVGGPGSGHPGSIEIDEATRPSGHDGRYHVGMIRASHPASGGFCAGLLAEQQSSLSADYRAFDQTMGEGWRKLSANECHREAALLIERYLDRNETLTAAERRNLSFHAGQVLARDDATEAAIPHFERAINPDEPADASFKWNAYVRATLAFLRNDREELARQREIVSRGRPRGGRVPNLDVVDRLLDNIGASYRDAYSVPQTKADTEPTDDRASGTPSKAALAKWQGSWQAYEYGSRSWTIRIDGDRFRGEVGPDDWYEGTVEIRPDADPGEIDLRIEDCRCSYRGEASKAIYRWDGEAVVMAAPAPGSRRPTRIDESSGQVVRLERLADD